VRRLCQIRDIASFAGYLKSNALRVWLPQIQRVVYVPRPMIRWTAAVALLIAALGCAWLAAQSTTPRGLTMRTYENLRWSGPATTEKLSEHLEYSPRLRRNRVQLADRTSLSLDGFIYAERGGKYDFRIESSDDVWLKIGGKTVVSHRRGKEESFGEIRLRKGYHPIRVQVRHRRGQSRLYVEWRLPSGYMNLEAISPIHLHPTVPKNTVLPLGMRLAPILLLFLALLTAFGPGLARYLRRLQREPEQRRLLATAIFLMAATMGMRVWDLNGAGETSDEFAYVSAGRTYISNIAHGRFESLYWHANEEHPPIGKYIYGVASHLSGTDDYSVLRLTSAVLASITVLITWAFGVQFFSAFVGLFAGLVLAFIPPFIAHGKVAALDSPSCTLFTLGVYLFVRTLMSDGPRRNLKFLGAGLVGCLAFATKFSNATLFIFMAVLHFASQWKSIRKRGTLELPITLYILPALPLLVLLAVWPWLWREPFGQLIQTLRHWDYPIQEWFLGRYRQPPVYYFPIAFLVTTPALLLVPFGAFFAAASRTRNFIHLTVLLWFLTPFLWTISVLKQDGIRYIYTMYPALALMMAIGAQHLVRNAAHVMVRPLLAGGTSFYLLWQCLGVHPYYLDYYSEAIGGTRTVFENTWFEVGWWGEGMDKAYQYVNEHAPAGATWDVLGVVNHTSDALREDLRYSPDRPDWLVKAYLTPGEVERDGYQEAHRVSVDDAPLVIVYVRSDLVQSGED
jgi:4-amino-4-deoxy-L-arabinose transferase-like glycosyltransferase